MLRALMSLLQTSLNLRLRAADASLSRSKLSMEDVFWDAAVFHATNVGLSQQGVHGWKASTRQDFDVGHFVLPGYA